MKLAIPVFITKPRASWCAPLLSVKPPRPQALVVRQVVRS